MPVMKNRKKYRIPVDERYRSALDEHKRNVLNGISYLSCLLSLISSVRLFQVSGRRFNLTPAAVTFYACEIVMLVSMVLSVHTDHKKQENIAYPELICSHGMLMIAGLAGMLFGLSAFQRPPAAMILLWLSIITAGVSGICSAAVYTSYQKNTES